MSFQKIEDYLNSLKPKEFIYVLLSIPIVVFMIYYNTAYPYMTQEEQKLIKEHKKQMKKLTQISSKIRKVKLTQKIIKPTREKLYSLREDYKFIKYSIRTLHLVNLKNKDIYAILTKILNKSKQLNLNISIILNWDIQYPLFTNSVEVSIKGEGNYLSYINLIRYIESLNNLVITKKTSIALNNNKEKEDPNSIKPYIQQISNDNYLSLTLTKYSIKDVAFLKNMAKKNNLNLSINVNKNNSDYLDLIFRGSFEAIKSLSRYFRNNKNLEFINLRTKLKLVKPVKIKKTQMFEITFDLVGLK